MEKSASPEEWTRRLPRFERRRGAQPRTQGQRIVNGVVVKELTSGSDEYTAKADTLWATIRRPEELTPLSITRDVEIKHAMWMRDAQVMNDVIVINNPKGPCPGKYGCDVLLERFLRPGATLTVFWPDRSDPRRVHSKTFHGRAKGAET